MNDLTTASQADLWTGYRHYNTEAMELEDAGEIEAAKEMERRRDAIYEETMRRQGR